jgi:hypothetical protein
MKKLCGDVGDWPGTRHVHPLLLPQQEQHLPPQTCPGPHPWGGGTPAVSHVTKKYAVPVPPTPIRTGMYLRHCFYLCKPVLLRKDTSPFVSTGTVPKNAVAKMGITVSTFPHHFLHNKMGALSVLYDGNLRIRRRDSTTVYRYLLLMFNSGQSKT